MLWEGRGEGSSCILLGHSPAQSPSTFLRRNPQVLFSGAIPKYFSPSENPKEKPKHLRPVHLAPATRPCLLHAHTPRSRPAPLPSSTAESSSSPTIFTSPSTVVVTALVFLIISEWIML